MVREADWITSPVIVNEGGDVTVFRSVKQLEQHLEPIDVENGEYTAYDATGRRLKLVVRTRPRRILFGLCQIPAKRVSVEMHSQDRVGDLGLRSVLERALEKAGADTATLRVAPLEQLVAEAERQFGVTR